MGTSHGSFQIRPCRVLELHAQSRWYGSLQPTRALPLPCITTITVNASHQRGCALELLRVAEQSVTQDPISTQVCAYLKEIVSLMLALSSFTKTFAYTEKLTASREKKIKEKSRDLCACVRDKDGAW